MIIQSIATQFSANLQIPSNSDQSSSMLTHIVESSTDPISTTTNVDILVGITLLQTDIFMMPGLLTQLPMSDQETYNIQTHVSSQTH